MRASIYIGHLHLECEARVLYSHIPGDTSHKNPPPGFSVYRVSAYTENGITVYRGEFLVGSERIALDLLRSFIIDSVSEVEVWNE